MEKAEDTADESPLAMAEWIEIPMGIDTDNIRGVSASDGGVD